MPAAPRSPLIDLLQSLTLGSTGPDAGNRFSLTGVTIGPGPGGARAIGIRSLEAASLRLAAGPLPLDAGRLAAGGAWRLGPLATAQGSIGAKIPDAHLMFDADVTVPIRRGEIDFGDATVEHVGPDSRMGVGPLGVYVDAPNGRSYLYQFPATPVPGVEYERRDAILGPFVSDRGKLSLQVFGEWLLSRGQAGPGSGLSGQARQLVERTTVSGELHLGDGRFTAPGVQADLVGNAGKHNLVRFQSPSLGRGMTVEVASLSARELVLALGDIQLDCAEITGAITLRVFSEGGQWRFELGLENAKLSGLRLIQKGA